MMRYMVGALAIAMWFAVPVLAQGKGKGSQKQKGAVERIADEAVDAVVDEIVGDEAPSGLPPGLAKQGKVPPGLAKQGKTPPGWEQGKKTGWGEGAAGSKKESLLRRLIRGIFRRRTPPDTE